MKIEAINQSPAATFKEHLELIMLDSQDGEAVCEALGKIYCHQQIIIVPSCQRS